MTRISQIHGRFHHKAHEQKPDQIYRTLQDVPLFASLSSVQDFSLN